MLVLLKSTAGRSDTHLRLDPLFVSRETNSFADQFTVKPLVSDHVFGPNVQFTV